MTKQAHPITACIFIKYIFSEGTMNNKIPDKIMETMISEYSSNHVKVYNNKCITFYYSINYKVYSIEDNIDWVTPYQNVADVVHAPIKYYDNELKELTDEIHRIRTEIPKNEIETLYDKVDNDFELPKQEI